MGLKRFRAPPHDYYLLLSVRPTATLKEIRAAYKEQMLKAHPDKNPGKRAWSERRAQELNEAFEVLSSSESRALFDTYRSRAGWGQEVKQGKSGRKPEARPQAFYFTRTDPKARAHLILHYLLHKKPGAALRLLQDMERTEGGGFLHRYLSLEDCLDCLFLLGELLATKREYERAAERLQAFLEVERTGRTLRHYHELVISLLKDLYLRKLPRVRDARSAIDGLSSAEALGLSESEECLRLRVLAELLIKVGDVRAANEIVARAQKLFPLSKETERLRRYVERAG